MASDDCFAYFGGISPPPHAPQLASCGVTNSTHPNVPCCWKGDWCLSDGICRYDHSVEGGSNYVAAGCSDPEFGPGCRKLCVNNEFADIVWDASTNTWRCCSFAPGEKRNCSNPTDERFDAPAPEDLTTIIHLPLTGVPTYPTATTKAPATTQPSSSAMVTSSSTSDKGSLSPGAAAGIGVGATLGVVLLLSLLGLMIYRRRRRRSRNRQHEVPRESPPPGFSVSEAPCPVLAPTVSKHDSTTPASELQGQHGPVEMAGTTPGKQN